MLPHSAKLILRYNISIMEHEIRRNFNQSNHELNPESHQISEFRARLRNSGPEIPEFMRTEAYTERRLQHRAQSEPNKKRENEPALNTIGERLTHLATMTAPTIGRAALLAIGIGLTMKGASALANHIPNQSIEQHQKDMEELGIPLEDEEENDYDRTFTGYEDYMNNEAQEFTPDNNLTIPEKTIENNNVTFLNTNLATPAKHHTTITLQDEKFTHTAEKTLLRTINFPAGAGQFKSFMDYKAITDKTTPNYNFTHENTNFHVGKSGLTYYQDGGNIYPVVAVGSGISDKIGQLIEVTLDNQGHPNTLRCVIGDQKDDNDTDPATHTVHKNDRSVVEFLVDYDRLKEANPTAANMGDLTYLDNSQFNLKGSVAKVQVLDQNFYSNENQ